MEITFENEDHTIGYLLQQYLLKDPDIVYAGYINPHPLENKIKMKIISRNSDDINTILQKTINNIKNDLKTFRVSLEY